MNEKYIIRHADMSDLEKITELERSCFTVSEAASAEDFFKRLTSYSDYFWILEVGGRIISMINGMVTNDSDLKDNMYHNAELHDKDGKWQMIFGVETHPDFQRNGYAGLLMERVIADAISDKRAGLVLTCKEKLIPYYQKFGFKNEGISDSVHGNTLWYQMRKSL